MLRARRGVEELRAGEQIGACALRGEAAHQARENVLLHHRGFPRERGEHGVAIRGAVRFERPPAEQGNARIGGIGIAAQQRGNQRQRLIRGQPARRGRHLRAHFGVGLGRGETQQRRRKTIRQFPGIAEQPDAPRAHGGLRVRERGERRGFVERAHLMQRPQGFQRGMLRRLAQRGAQRIERRGIAPLAEQAHGGLAMPAVRMREQRDELRARFHREIHVLFERHVFSAKAVDAPGARVDLALVVLPVRDVFLVEIRHVNRAVGRVREIDRAERRIGPRERDAGVARLEGRAARVAFADDDIAVQWIGGEEASGIARGQRGAVGDDRRVGEARDGVAAFHHVEKAEGERMSGRPEFSRIDALLQHQRLLHVVKAARPAAVVAGVQPSLAVEIQLEHIAAALRENLVGFRGWMIPPDHAALVKHAGEIRRVHAGARDAARRGAALPAVEPAVRSPHEPVRD